MNDDAQPSLRVVGEPAAVVAWPAVSSFSEAARLRDLLQAEVGHTYQVEEREDGFTVVRAGGPEESRPPVVSRAQDQAFAPLELRPAWRIGWGKGLMAGLAGTVAITAQDFVPALIERLFGASVAAQIAASVPMAPGDVVAVVALGVCVLVLGRWIYNRYSRLYRVTDDAIEEVVGIVAIQTRRVRLQHVRSVGLQQTLVGRLFNVGNLEFSSAGTGEIDIRFIGIRRPAAVRNFIHELINRH